MVRPQKILGLGPLLADGRQETFFNILKNGIMGGEKRSEDPGNKHQEDHDQTEHRPPILGQFPQDLPEPGCPGVRFPGFQRARKGFYFHKARTAEKLYCSFTRGSR